MLLNGYSTEGVGPSSPPEGSAEGEASSGATASGAEASARSGDPEGGPGAGPPGTVMVGGRRRRNLGIIAGLSEEEVEVRRAGLGPASIP